MNFLKKALDNYLTDFFEEKSIQILCLDSKTDDDFYLKLQSYPPIGALINLDENQKLFKIESLEIQSAKGLFCIAKGVFIE